MAKASEKDKAIDGLLKGMGMDRVGSITKNVCVLCHGKADVFEDELSEREYAISGMCQQCQNGVFKDVDQVYDEEEKLIVIEDENELRRLTAQLIDRTNDLITLIEDTYPSNGVDELSVAIAHVRDMIMTIGDETGVGLIKKKGEQG